ncbi:MAG: AAA family ATPase [Acidobacteriota bacterium]|nr:AAA family ATPase [Acidobacteriota bacterium]
MPKNPYIAGNPVGNSNAFFGRDDILRRVMRMLRRPQDDGIVLYGQRRIGKTSILQKLSRILPEKGPWLPILFDLQDKATLPLDEVIRGLAGAIGKKLECDGLAPDSNVQTDFRKTWLPGVLSRLPQDGQLVVLFDEFDVVGNVNTEGAASELFPYLRKLLSPDYKGIKFVFVVGRNVEDLRSKYHKSL